MKESDRERVEKRKGGRGKRDRGGRGGEESILVKMLHEELESGVVCVWELVDLPMELDVTQTFVVQPYASEEVERETTVNNPSLKERVRTMTSIG
jgi:hypothetical protein